jgi:transposase
MQETVCSIKPGKRGRKPKVAPPSQVELELLLFQSMSTAQIAARYGVSRFVALGWLEKYDLAPSFRRGGKPIDWTKLDPQIRQIFPKLKSIGLIAAKLGVSYNSMKIRLIHLGLLKVKNGNVFDWPSIDADVKRFTEQGISLRSIAIGKGIKFKSLRARYPEHMLRNMCEKAQQQKMAAD